MIRKDKKQGQQNKGFTLLEVLVAITILSIIVVPLLQAFVTSAGVNAKARREMNATSVAENVIEEIKSSSLEDIAKQFNGYVSGGFTEMVSDADDLYEYVKIVADDGTVTYQKADNTNLAEKDDASVKDAANPEGMFVGHESNEYIFRMESVKMDSSSFDVAVHLTPNANGKYELADIYSMNQANCGYYAQSDSMDLKVAENYQMKNAAYIYDAIAQKDSEEFMKMMTRTITIDVNEDSVDITYTYQIPVGYTEEADRIYTEKTRIFENTVSKAELEAVYIYYYPLYNDKIDPFVINNNGNLDIDIFLIEMNLEEGVANLKKESQTTIDVNNESGDIRICTNMYSPIPSGITTDKIVALSNKKEIVSLYDITVEVYSDTSTGFNTGDLISTQTGTFRDSSR